MTDDGGIGLVDDYGREVCSWEQLVLRSLLVS